jgi:arsenate reductase
MKRSILFLCTANSIRSQIAQALLETLSQDFVAYSAGTMPTGAVDKHTIRILREIGIDISACRPLDIEQFRHTHLDILITMSSTAYRDCPAWLYENPSIICGHWGFTDVSGQSLSQFRKLRNQIEAHLRAFLAEYRPELTRDELAALVRRFTR